MQRHIDYLSTLNDTYFALTHGPRTMFNVPFLDKLHGKMVLAVEELTSAYETAIFEDELIRMATEEDKSAFIATRKLIRTPPLPSVVANPIASAINIPTMTQSQQDFIAMDRARLDAEEASDRACHLKYTLRQAESNALTSCGPITPTPIPSLGPDFCGGNKSSDSGDNFP